MGIIVDEYLKFAGKSSLDFGVRISGSGTFNAPERDVESVSVPGRNGDLHIDNGRFANISIVYPAFIVKDFRHNFDAFKAFLLSKRGYEKLEDSYHPEYYRLAAYKAAIEPAMATRNVAGSFDITFDCDPRRFLKSGEAVKTMYSGGTISNPTLYEALPLIRAYGTGYFEINGVRVTISTANTYTDIDSDLQEAYKGTTSCNGNITLSTGMFPTLMSGTNLISMSGLSRIEITPRYWTV